MIIDFEGEEKVNMDVSFWTWPSYWKAGVYLQDDGTATAHFDDLFEEDGTQQNFFPSVEISSPDNNTNFEPGEDIIIDVEANDSDGTVTLVEFFEGGSNKLGEATTAPFSFTWTGAAEGEYTLTAKATDNEGGSRSSLSTRITVAPQIDVTGVELEMDGPVAVGGTGQVKAFILPANATNQNFTFDVDDSSIATVDESGLVTGIAEGQTTVIATTQEGAFTNSVVINVLAPSSKFNWALFQPITGTGIPDGSNVEENLVDDNTDTRWSVEEFPQSATVDLLGDIKITQTEVTCYQDRAYQFTIEGASDLNGPYTMLVDRTNNATPGKATIPIINTVDSIEATFIRVTVLSADVYTGPWVSLTELRVFGEGERIYSDVDDVPLNKVVLSPNPANSIVTIEGAEDYKTVSVYDQSGRRVMQANIDNLKTLDVSSLQAGIYVIKFEGDDIPYVSKLIKH